MKHLQSFIPGANHWLGRGPKSALAQVTAQAQAAALASLSELSLLFSSFIPAPLLQPNKDKQHSRRRFYSLGCTFLGFLAQVLTPRTACMEVVRMVQSFCSAHALAVPRSGDSAYCQARKKLDINRLLSIHRHLADTLSQRLSPGWLWQTRKVLVVDGTSLQLADTGDNQLAYPQPSQQRPGCGFPVMQVVACFCLHTGALLHWASSQLQRHESPLLRSLLPLMEKGSIVLTDRGYCSYSNLALCVEHQLDAVMRLHQARKVDMRCGKKLGKLDRLAEWKRPQRPKKGWSKDEWRQLPNTLAIRVVRLKIQNRGFRPHQLWIATTLTDAKLYPKEALVELYRRRWQAELFLRDMKTTMGMEQLRCKSPSMVQKEFVMFAIAYNLLRLLMADAALLSSQQPYQLSFKGAADTLRHYKSTLWLVRKRPKKLKKVQNELLWIIADIRVADRPGRTEPRAKKRRPKPYQNLTRPRSEMRVSESRKKK